MAKGIKIMNQLAELMANTKGNKQKPIEEQDEDSLNPQKALKQSTKSPLSPLPKPGLKKVKMNG